MTFNYSGHRRSKISQSKKDGLLYLVTHGCLSVPVLNTPCRSSVGGHMYKNCVTHLLLDPIST